MVDEVPEDVFEVLRERNREAGVLIDANTTRNRGGTYRPDLGACIGAVLDRTVGSRFYYVPTHGRAQAEVA